MGVLAGGPTAHGIDFAQGEMNIGEPMAVPIIRELKKWEPVSLRGTKQSQPMEDEIASGKNALRNDILEIRDAPPGASCPVVESIRGADFVLLVTEPTPFGLHDLKQVAGVVKELGIPAGVIINRDGIGDNAVETYCAESGLPVLMRIPMDRQVAEGIAQGHNLVEIRPEFGPALRDMLEQIAQRVA
jgi:MinD superfamily P-loop ATPase